MKLAVFDVCGTLYRANTMFAFVDAYCRGRRGYAAFRKLRGSRPARLANAVLHRLTGRDLFRAWTLRWLAGAPADELAACGERLVRETLAGLAHQPVTALLRRLSEDGYTIALASGSLDLIVRPAAQALGASHWAAAMLGYTVGGAATGRLQQDLLLSKREWVIAGFRDLERLVVVTDNKTDRPLVELADEAYAVTASERDRRFWTAIGHPMLTLLEV
ncbi:haloacid dehalogenase-like hydrolase [Paenibacillus athensensis]|uniref:Haloacid dehalogenase n=1 Tax=Paenibacillus athensensis TaxID=1967502 RepID=A0A4Y8PW95_9BACL|nr:haloacid dehalogenase-like hydrolase [Paenibacillus athensensis]MCD1258759.1 haloacid dehalogenase-like hydrolase [Paenibacillus athensensis]